GIFARSASSTELRPVTFSVSSPDFALGARFGLLPPLLVGRPPGRPLPPAAANRSLAAFRLPATCQARSSALGVGPRPSSDLRPSPPVPLSGPFFLPLCAPGRGGLAINTPMSSVCCVFQSNACRRDRVADA